MAAPEGKAAEAPGAPAMELEHAIGYAGNVFKGLICHPNGRDFVYVAGAVVVICDFSDPHNQEFLRGHDDDISTIDLSPTGKMLASAQIGVNADVCVWDYARRELIYRFSEHDYGVGVLSFSDDERLLVSAGNAQDKRIFVWDLSTGMINTTMAMDPMPVTALQCGGMVKDVKRRATSNYLIAAAGPKHVVVYSLNPMSGEMSGTRVTTTTSFQRDYTSLVFSPDREWLFAGTTSGDFGCINMKSLVMQSTVYACSGGVLSMLGVDGGIAVGGGDGSVTLFRGYAQDLVDAARCRLTGSVRSMSAGPSRGEVLAGTTAGYINRVRLGGGGTDTKAIVVSENHAAAGAGLGEGVGGGGGSGAAGVGQATSGAVPVASVGGVAAVGYAVGVSDRFVSVGDDNTVRLWDASDYSCPVKSYVKDAGHPSSVAFSLDFMLSGWGDGEVRCHATETGESLWNLPKAHKGGVTTVMLSNNQRFGVTGGADGALRVWELRSRDMVTHLKEHSLAVTATALYEDDIHCVSVGRDKTLLCWDLRVEKRISSHHQRVGGIHTVALTPDQSLVLTAGQDRNITYWDLREPSPVQMISRPHGDSGEATFIACAHGRDIIASGGTDSHVRLWDLRMAKEISDGVGHSGVIRGMHFAPDDRQLVSVGADGCIFVWNVYAE